MVTAELKVVVGLGNPGAEYEQTRHNVGFMVLDRLAARYGCRFRKGPGQFLFTRHQLNTQPFFMIKPTTYMNQSGLAVRQVVDYYNIENFQRLLIVLDDLNLPFGQLRLRKQGSDGGQKGLRSIIQHLGSKRIPRLRIGIGNGYQDARRFVLSPFSGREKKMLPQILDVAADAVEVALTRGMDEAMNRFNRNVLEEPNQGG